MYFQLFNNNDNKILLKKYPIDKNTRYLRYLDEMRDNGLSHIILNSKLLLDMVDLFVGYGWNVNNIDLDDNQEIDVNLYHFTLSTPLDHKLLLLNKLKYDVKKYNLIINSISISNNNYTNDFIIKSNGLVEIDGENPKELKEMIELIINTILKRKLNVYT